MKIISYFTDVVDAHLFLPCKCIKCNARYSHERNVCQSVRPSNVCIVTKRKKLVPTFLYHMKDCSS